MNDESSTHVYKLWSVVFWCMNGQIDNFPSAKYKTTGYNFGKNCISNKISLAQYEPMLSCQFASQRRGKTFLTIWEEVIAIINIMFGKKKWIFKILSVYVCLLMLQCISCLCFVSSNKILVFVENVLGYDLQVN